MIAKAFNYLLDPALEHVATSGPSHVKLHHTELRIIYKSVSRRVLSLPIGFITLCITIYMLSIQISLVG